MARAFGSSAHLLMKRETTYGQVAAVDYLRMPFDRCNLGSEQALINDPVLGQGHDPLAPLQDVITEEDDMIVRSTRGISACGSPACSAIRTRLTTSMAAGITSSPRVATTCRATRSEVGMPKVPAFFLHAGVKLNSIALEFTRSGPPVATQRIAQGETPFGTTQGGTPTSLTFGRISQFQRSISAPAIRDVDIAENGPWQSPSPGRRKAQGPVRANTLDRFATFKQATNRK